MAKDPKRNPHPLAPTNTGNPAGTQRPRVAQVQKGMSVQKKTLAGGGEPATANPRKNIQERMGAKRRIEIKLPGPESPEAYQTQSRGRIVPSVMGSKQNFWSQGGQKW